MCTSPRRQRGQRAAALAALGGERAAAQAPCLADTAEATEAKAAVELLVAARGAGSGSP